MKIQNKGNGKAEILIYEEIGEGWFGGIGAKRVAEDVKALGTLDEINVRINSDGGQVFDGFAIYNTLVRNSARIVVDVDGLAASIASIIAMAGDEINMAANASMMIHDPWGFAAGTAEEMRKTAELMDQLRSQLVDTYNAQANIDAEKISELMSEETWMTADQALEWGFIHNVTNELQIAASANYKLLNRFKNAPETLLNNENMLQSEATEQAKQDASVQLSKMSAKTRSYK